MYALADNAYKALTIDKKNQAVIISGESGAGKTEATKLVLQYMAEMSGQGSEVEQQLLQANPILEAFGNAKTVRNNNSSRFGKWVEIIFNAKYHIYGARIVNYLLEKSRIVTQGSKERNYHFFYQLCAGASAEEKKEFRLDHPRTYRITSEGDCYEAEGIDDIHEYNHCIQAMKILHFSDAEILNLKKVTAALLHLGNVQFSDNDKTSIKNPDTVSHVAALMGLNIPNLSQALVSQKKKMGREMILTVMNQRQADDARDAMTKAVYSKMFNWLIRRINQTLFKQSDVMHIVGVLDIFGFEIFKTNRFEQLCINFANEKMQQHFNEHIFSMEQREYKAENIDVAHVEFKDNQECLDMIEKGKVSLLGMLDEELRVPRGSDDKLLEKYHQQFGKSPHYQKPKTMQPVFGINHYAGCVDYNVHGFMVKNKDKLGEDVAEALLASENAFVAEIMSDNKAQDDSDSSGRGKRKTKTVGGQFKTQLADLMTTLKSTSPHFIRCIKSNSLKVSDTFEAPMVLRQLRYLGLKEVVNIRQLGYPIRRLHQDFWRRYSLLSDEVRRQYQGRASVGVSDASAIDHKTACAALCVALNLEATEWRVGNTKVFLRTNLQDVLEKLREEKLKVMVDRLQAMARTKLWRAKYKRVKISEEALRHAIAGEDIPALETAITDYESLQLLSNKELIKQAYQRRNQLHAQLKAKASLETIFSSKLRDINLVDAAIQGADKAGLTDAAYPLLAKARQLFRDLHEYTTLVQSAIERKDLDLCKQAVARAKELELDGSVERQVNALMNQLSKEMAMKNRLTEAMKSRDLDALRHALQVAMDAESGAMVGSMLDKARAAGLADDPIVKQAIALESTLTTEVSVFKLAAELQAAIDSNDFHILESVTKIAREKNFTTHNLYKEAMALMQEIKFAETLLSALAAGVNSKNITELESLYRQAQGHDRVINSNEYKAAVGYITQYNDASLQLSEVMEGKTAHLSSEQVSARLAAANAMGFDTSKARSALQAGDIMHSLTSACEAKDMGMLKAALTEADNVDGFDTSVEPYTWAKALLSELEDNEFVRNQELQSAEAAASAARDSAAKPPSEYHPKSRKKTGDSKYYYDHKQVELNIKEYSSSKYTFARYSKLRSPNDYVASLIMYKQFTKEGRLGFIKGVIPTSLTKMDKQSLVQSSIHMFKSIQGFMGNRHYSFPDSLVPEIAEMALSCSELRCELFAQLMKQLILNPSMDSVLKGWMLMSLICEVMPPTPSFLPFVVHFLYANTTSPTSMFQEADENTTPTDIVNLKTIMQYAQYCIQMLRLTLSNFDESRHGPSSSNDFLSPSFKSGKGSSKDKDAGVAAITIDHVSAFRARTMMPADVLISFPDGSTRSFFIQPWDTCNIFVPTLAETIGIQKTEHALAHYGLFEVRGAVTQLLKPTECVLDVCSRWKHLAKKQVVSEEKPSFWTRFKSGLSGSKASVVDQRIIDDEDVDVDDGMNWKEADDGVRRLVFQHRIYGKKVAFTDDPVKLKLLYYEFARSLATGQYTVPVELAATFAAMAKHIIANDRALSSCISGDTQERLTDAYSQLQYTQAPPNLLAAKATNLRKWDKLVNKTMDKNPQVKQATYRDALDLVKDLVHFGSTCFHVRQSYDDRYPGDLYFCVNSSGVSIQEGVKRVELDHFGLMNIMGWSSSPVLVLVKIKLNKKTEGGKSTATLRFNTPTKRMGEEICDLLLSYAHTLIDEIKRKKKAKKKKKKEKERQAKHV